MCLGRTDWEDQIGTMSVCTQGAVLTFGSKSKSGVQKSLVLPCEIADSESYLTVKPLKIRCNVNKNFLVRELDPYRDEGTQTFDNCYKAW
jgi:hypothetical protein